MPPVHREDIFSRLMTKLYFYLMSLQRPLTDEDRQFYRERDALLRECQDLLWQLSRRPYCMKLLLGVKKQLLMFLAYKANRTIRSNVLPLR